MFKITHAQEDVTIKSESLSVSSLVVGVCGIASLPNLYSRNNNKWEMMHVNCKYPSCPSINTSRGRACVPTAKTHDAPTYSYSIDALKILHSVQTIKAQ